MKARNLVLAVAVVPLLGAGGYALYRAGMVQGSKRSVTVSAAGVPAGETSHERIAGASPGRKILYWHDPMVPQRKFDRPGKSPFMDMQLVPVYEGEDGEESTVKISPRVQQNLGVRTAEVVTGTLTSAIEAVGSVAYNERDVVVVQARSNGFVEKLQVRAPLDRVRKGQPLAEIYVPDWVAAQEEYLSAKRIAATGVGESLKGLEQGAVQRMRLAGMTDEQIRLVESTGAVHARTTVTAPASGVVTELGAREGMTIAAGATLFRINGLTTVWVNAEVPENVAAQVRPGNPVEARTPALPGAVFKGKVNAILPEVSVATRTLKVRIEVANADGRLVPGMFATVNFAPGTNKETLLVPTEAVIQTGKRTVVLVMQGDAGFIPVDVQIGAESGERTEIRSGLKAGQKVVVSGQFLIDSEASLRGTATRMGDTPAASDAVPTGLHRGEGKVERVDKNTITLSHGPIPSLKWGAMTMAFNLPANALHETINVGDAVTFEIRQIGGGAFEMVSISRTASSPAPVKSEAKSGGVGQTKEPNK
jgi:Cu(I)/Ag(I) efflux system membrane fusion protein